MGNISFFIGEDGFPYASYLVGADTVTKKLGNPSNDLNMLGFITNIDMPSDFLMNLDAYGTIIDIIVEKYDYISFVCSRPILFTAFANHNTTISKIVNSQFGCQALYYNCKITEPIIAISDIAKSAISTSNRKTSVVCNYSTFPDGYGWRSEKGFCFSANGQFGGITLYYVNGGSASANGGYNNATIKPFKAFCGAKAQTGGSYWSGTIESMKKSL